LGLGQVQLADGQQVCGFIAEGIATQSGKDISDFGGWKNYLQSLNQ